MFKGIAVTFYWLKWGEGTQFGCRSCVEENVNFEVSKITLLISTIPSFLQPPSLIKGSLQTISALIYNQKALLINLCIDLRVIIVKRALSLVKLDMYV